MTRMPAVYVYDRLVDRLLSKRLRQAIGRRWYEFISRLDRGAQMLFMNYGYADLHPDATKLALSAEEEKHRYSIQLYHHIASAIEWTGLQALEVGVGRGGGAAYVKQHFTPKSIVGIDICANAIQFCNQYYAVEGLSFIHADVESLPFANECFDVVLNVEASGLWVDVDKCFGEIVRVLRPKGYFLYADLQYRPSIGARRDQLGRTGLQLLKEEDITPNVFRALELDRDHRRELIGRYAPRVLRGILAEFAGTTGAGFTPGLPEVRQRVYLSSVLRKNGIH